jgi:hypothetical protein
MLAVVVFTGDNTHLYLVLFWIKFSLMIAQKSRNVWEGMCNSNSIKLTVNAFCWTVHGRRE